MRIVISLHELNRLKFPQWHSFRKLLESRGVKIKPTTPEREVLWPEPDGPTHIFEDRASGVLIIDQGSAAINDAVPAREYDSGRGCAV